MKKQLFNELVQSIREAGAIHRGESAASRRFVFRPQDVRAIREKLQKSQNEFAQMIGVSVATLQNWEQGRRPIPMSTRDSGLRSLLAATRICGRGGRARFQPKRFLRS